MITNKMVWAFVAGAAVGALMAMAMALPVLHRDTALVEQMSAQIVEYESAGTVLYEPAQTHVELRGAAQDRDPWAALDMMAQAMHTQTGQVARWYIPAKVKPLYYGDHPGEIPPGVSFAYYSPEKAATSERYYPLRVYPK